MRNYRELRKFDFIWTTTDSGHYYLCIDADYDDILEPPEFIARLLLDYEHMTTCVACHKSGCNETSDIHARFMYAIAT